MKTKVVSVINSISKESTVIKQVRWESERQDLKVTFKSGKVYVYTPVSQEFYKKLYNSTSKGKFFNEHIKNNQALTCLKMIK